MARNKRVWNKQGKTHLDMDPNELNRFIEEWNRGTAAKVMAEHFGLRHDYVVLRARKELGLEPRFRPTKHMSPQDRDAYRKERTAVLVGMNKTLHRSASRRACERGCTVAAYIRYLITRDAA